MTNTLAARAITLALCSVAACACCSSYEFEELYADLPFEMARVERPAIPSRTVDIRDFGGVGDGITLNTEAFERAMQSLADNGGGHLTVPAGIWFTGPVTFRSNIDLHVEKEAVIVFSDDLDLYRVVDTNFEGLDTRRCIAPLNGRGLKNISITGGGVIDGNGDMWRDVKKSKLTSSEWKKVLARPKGVLNEKGDVWYPDEGYVKGRESAGSLNVPDKSLDENEIKSFFRPVLLSFIECENVLLEDCTFQNSPCWNLHPLWCRNVIIKDITVRAPYYAQNSDGIDIDGCENVIVTGASFDVGDDGICIKSGKDADGRRHARTCRNLIIDRCTVYHGHGGFVVGSEMSGGVQNVKVSRCRFLGTDIGLRFKSTRGRGGVVEGIWAEDIMMKDIIGEAVLFNLYYAGVSALDAKLDDAKADIQPVDETTPEFRDIHISRITCNGAARAMFFNGLPEMPVRGIDLQDCCISAREGIVLHHCKDITIKDMKLKTEKGEAVSTLDVEGLRML